MMTKFCDVDAEKYATDGWWFEGGFSLTTGVPYVGMSDGKIVQNLDNALIEKAQTFMLNMNTKQSSAPESAVQLAGSAEAPCRRKDPVLSGRAVRDVPLQ